MKKILVVLMLFVAISLAVSASVENGDFSDGNYWEGETLYSDSYVSAPYSGGVYAYS